MLSRTITLSLTPKTRKGHGGRLHSRAVNNGSGRLEFRTELTASEQGSEE